MLAVLAVLVQIPVGDLQVLAASAACLKLIVAYLPQNIVSLINKKTVTGHKKPSNSWLNSDKELIYLSTVS